MTQKEALKVMLSGANVFLTGAPGAGKTFVLNEFIERAEEKGLSLARTASTGIAASHIGGVTIHSWSGLGISELITKDDLRRLDNNKRVVKRFRNADVLIIDEVSMLHGHRLDMVNVVAKHLRANPAPFGGLQVILVGDLFQLPPVNRESSEMDFVHTSHAWDELNLQICYLTEQHRQEGTDGLLGLLVAMRQNKVSQAHLMMLKDCMSTINKDDTITKLYSHNIDVDSINMTRLDALEGKSKRYTMVADGDRYIRETLIRNVLAPETLILKVGAEVMFVANNFQEGFFNGTRGRIVKFNKAGNPVVELKSGRRMGVDVHTWSIKENDRVLASIEQIPLRLAWAITIHKSQGMTLDAAEIDLSRAFTPAMGYVALSRVKSLDGLFLKGINDMALMMHPDIYEFDARLQELSK